MREIKFRAWNGKRMKFMKDLLEPAGLEEPF